MLRENYLVSPVQERVFMHWSQGEKAYAKVYSHSAASSHLNPSTITLSFFN